MGVKLAVASGGSIELVPTNTASNFTVTVPAVTATMLTTASAGTVLQVVNATYATYGSTTSTSYADTGLTASITPTSASNKILVIVSLSGVGKSGFNTNAKYQLVRGATAILGIDNGTGFTNTTGYGMCSATANYLDSPATTSATTYKVQYGIDTSGGTAYINFSQNAVTTSTITLMEIAA